MKKKPTKRRTTPATLTAEPEILWTRREWYAAIRTATNRLLSAHSLLHGAVESRALLAPDARVSRLPMIRNLYDIIQTRLTEAQQRYDTGTQEIGNDDPMLVELWRALALVRKSSSFLTARELLGENT